MIQKTQNKKVSFSFQKIQKKVKKDSVKFICPDTYWTATRPYLTGFQNASGSVKYRVDEEVFRIGNHFDRSAATTALTIVNFTQGFDFHPYHDLTRQSFAVILESKTPVNPITPEEGQKLLNHFGTKAENFRKLKFDYYTQQYRAQRRINQENEARAEEFYKKIKHYTGQIIPPRAKGKSCVIHLID